MLNTAVNFIKDNLSPQALLSLAKNNAGAISGVIGKSADDIRNAISTAQDMMPDLERNGVGALKKLGVSSEFVDDVYSRYGRFLGKVPGASRSDVDRVKRGLEEPNRATRRANAKKEKRNKRGGFDKSAYLDGL